MKIRLLLAFLFLTFQLLWSQNYNYLGTFTSNGTPNYLESPGDNVAVSTLELIDNSLPGTFDIPTYFPHYLTSNYDCDIEVTQTTDVFVTFVEDNVGFRNTLGFFTYDINNPPTTPPSDEEVTIIFPNASRLGFGGGLQIGDKVNIGNFPAGTGISFVLLSNGWNGSAVTYGYWQLYSNPNLNSGTDPSLKHQSVLLKDDTNSFIVLGYEDLHRDDMGCESDSDFNDVIFYVSAPDYNSLETNNIPNATTSNDVYTSNLGGFESNGDFLMAIAERNIMRLKDNTELNTRLVQPLFNPSLHKSNNNLERFFPETGMFEMEEAHVSTSQDPVNYSNATDVFSLDYYLFGERVLAGLVTSTEGRVYDHSKHTCDRLNQSEIIDVRTVLVNGYHMVFSMIRRDNGYIEYTIIFSVEEGETENKLHSYWNISDYPEGDFLNFQVWGKTMGQVANLVNVITSKLAEEKPLVASGVDDLIPTVIVSSAEYRNEKLVLDIINRDGSQSASVNANLRATEQSDLEYVEMPVSLSGDYYEQIEISTGFIFDAGFSLLNDQNDTKDNFYVADGTWGIDFNPDQSSLISYTVLEQVEDLNLNVYEIERGASLSGRTSGTFNLFRYVLPGDLSFNTSDFDGVRLHMKNDHKVMISLVPEGIQDWEDRWVYTIPENPVEDYVRIRFDHFHNQHGQNPGNIDNVKMIMFSSDGTEQDPIEFQLEIKSVAFANAVSLSTDDLSPLANEGVYNYPNPFLESTTIQFPHASDMVNLKVYDILGRMVSHENLETLDGGKSVNYRSNGASTGLYFYILEDQNNNKYKGNFFIMK